MFNSATAWQQSYGHGALASGASDRSRGTLRRQDGASSHALRKPVVEEIGCDEAGLGRIDGRFDCRFRFDDLIAHTTHCPCAVVSDRRIIFAIEIMLLATPDERRPFRDFLVKPTDEGIQVSQNRLNCKFACREPPADNGGKSPMTRVEQRDDFGIEVFANEPCLPQCFGNEGRDHVHHATSRTARAAWRCIALVG